MRLFAFKSLWRSAAGPVVGYGNGGLASPLGSVGLGGRLCPAHSRRAVTPGGSRSSIAGGVLAWIHSANLASISAAESRSKCSAGPGGGILVLGSDAIGKCLLPVPGPVECATRAAPRELPANRVVNILNKLRSVGGLKTPATLRYVSNWILCGYNVTEFYVDTNWKCETLRPRWQFR
jgi:hypothetical protein